jgi:D-apiose dehydrogenase
MAELARAPHVLGTGNARRSNRDPVARELPEPPLGSTLISPTEQPLRIAAVGLGFWAQFQVRAWRELERQGLVRLVAICGSELGRATHFQHALGSPAVPVYTELETLLREVSGLGAVDLITPTATHYALTKQVLAHRIPVIVQKPMAQTLGHGLAMVRDARIAGMPLLVHEDFRWQKPFVELRRLVAERRDCLGSLVDIRVEWESGGEDFLRGQPYFATQVALVNGEVGVHLIDILRFLSGRNVTRITSAHMHRGVDLRYQGEDIAHVTLDLQGGISAAYRVAFSAAHKNERPPQTFVRMLFQRGTIELDADYELTITALNRNSAEGIAKSVETVRVGPEAAAWTQDPALNEYQSWLGQWESCLPTNRACAEFIRGNFDIAGPVTTAEDNLNVLATMLSAYLAFEGDVRVNIPQTFEGLGELSVRLDEARIGYPNFPQEDVLS